MLFVGWVQWFRLIIWSYFTYRLQEDPPTGVSGAPTDNNIMIWNAVIFGPHDTPFEDGTFKLTIEFTEEYPNKPPTVRFVSKMFHPNVYADGGICLDILQNRWSPTYDVSAILTSIQVQNQKRTNFFFLVNSIVILYVHARSYCVFKIKNPQSLRSNM